MYGEMYHRVYHAPDALHHASSGPLDGSKTIYMVLCDNVLRFSAEARKVAVAGRQGVTFR